MKTGLALSGGGIRGAAHIGVLRALEELRIPIHFLSGSSAGAVAAGLYAYGSDCNSMEQLALSLDAKLLDPDWVGAVHSVIRRMTGRQPSATGLLRGRRLEKVLTSICGKASVRETRIPLAVCAVDVIANETVYFVSEPLKSKECCETDVSLADAICASCAVPMVFSSRMIRGRQLVDGGVLENLPVDILFSMGADRVIAVDLSRKDCVCPIRGVPEMGTECLRLMSERLLELGSCRANVILHPKLDDVSTFDFTRIPQCIRAGYECVMDQRVMLQRSLFTQASRIR